MFRPGEGQNVENKKKGNPDVTLIKNVSPGYNWYCRKYSWKRTKHAGQTLDLFHVEHGQRMLL